MTSSRIKIGIVTLFLISVFFIAPRLKADDQIPIQPSDISVDTSPENPQPYQDVTITLSSYSTDLTKANIQWNIGSKTVLSGYGKTTYSFTTGATNTQTAFTIYMTLDSGDQITKQIVISPSEVALLWEALDSYTPPFYRGKAFLTQTGMVRVVAIPNTTTITKGAGSVSYAWRNKDNAVQDASGYNKSAYTFQNSTLDSREDISVTASSVDGLYSATNEISVPITIPQLVFYKKSPTDGILFNQALGDQANVSEDQATVVGVPYYLALKGNESKFNYNWQINDQDIDTPSHKTELTIHPTSHGGYATISFTIENPDTLFQKISKVLTLNL